MAPTLLDGGGGNRHAQPSYWLILLGGVVQSVPSTAAVYASQSKL
jgi:hypothetical protein